MPRRGDEVVSYIVGQGDRLPITRRDQRRMRMIQKVPGVFEVLCWLDCSVPLTRGRFTAVLVPGYRALRERGL